MSCSQSRRSHVENIVSRLAPITDQDRCVTAAQELGALLATSAKSQEQLLEVAEQVICANGVLPLLHMLQCKGASESKFSKSQDDRSSRAAFDCCQLLCKATDLVLQRAGWTIIEDPDDGRPAYLHKASNMLRNSAPDIDWPLTKQVNATDSEES
eukprot:TRINITY_DN44402_c0_g1_i1.p1 TRINITY_DN44402_c0_g1~~TRINITY_DN44402_c0_g1_i1.p1  ORF type:complete len:168 (+),score=10.56 TRINITY_DN44402_c0_g1_i1:42-506(+)